MSLLDEFPEEDLPVEVETEVIQMETMRGMSANERRATDLRRLQQTEDEIYKDSARVISAAMNFADIENPDEGEAGSPPKEWIDRWGMKEAKRRQRIALAAGLPSRFAPVGLKMAQTVFVGITKAREGRKEAPVMHVQVVQMPASRYYNLPEKNVEE